MHYYPTTFMVIIELEFIAWTESDPHVNSRFESVRKDALLFLDEMA